VRDVTLARPHHDITQQRGSVAPAAIYCARVCTCSRQNSSNRWERWNIVDPYIPYGLFQTTGVTCAKFGCDRFRNVDLYKLQTNKYIYTFIFIYKIYLLHKYSNILQTVRYKQQGELCLFAWFIHLAVCLTTGPKPLPKRALHIVWSRASCFKWEYPALSLRSSNSFLHHLPCLSDTSISPCIYPLVTHCRRQFLRKMLPIEFSFRLRIHSLVFSPVGWFSRNQDPVRRPVWPSYTASWARS
jgi:hypothetical protein